MVFKRFGFLPALVLLRSMVLAADSDSCAFDGGFALRTPNAECPEDASVSCGQGLQIRCCPSGFECGYNDSYCCETGVDCKDEANDHPQCPDTTWSVWSYNENGTLGWCCDSGYFGFSLLDGSGVGCQAVGDTIDTTSSKTVYEIATKTASVCSSSTTSATTSATTTTTTTAPATSTPAASTQSKGLSGGSIAGIAIGASAAIVIAAMAARFFLRRSQQKKDALLPVEELPADKPAGGGAAAGEDKTTSHDGVYEMEPGNERHEMQAENQRYEMASEDRPSEMDGQRGVVHHGRESEEVERFELPSENYRD
ncbi:hypothetical protein GGR57DRAFT_374769 [Xylariaceae sp. FL1272]|nr:hypothetical protein GGR57DRAFT_374769 [Xylariaceae sp. FL1272]